MRLFFFFKQKTAYEMRISDWSSDVCSSDLLYAPVYFLALPSHLATTPWPEIGLQLVQGILSGVISLFTYSVAVTRLGPTKAAAFGALAPALAAVAAIPQIGRAHV